VGLHRSAIGGLVLDAALAPGQWRWLGPAERRLLQAPEVGSPASAAR
jgi:16S rRNA pseudouridine516 synthase